MGDMEGARGGENDEGEVGLHEFVGEDAHGVDGGGFGTEDDGAEAEG